jgi:ABC-type transporter Mla subunit MlaD
MTTTIILTVLGILSSIGILAGGGGYLISQFKKGSKAENNAVISSADQLAGFWKEQVEGFRDVIKDLTAKLEKQKDDHTIEMKQILSELGEVKGQLTAERAQNERLEKIFQNRDPETKKFMEIMIQFIKDQAQVNSEIVRVLSEIHNYAQQEHDRDFVVTSTIKKDGEKI